MTRKRGSLGELEQLALLSVLRLGSEAYGVPIMREIEERTGRRVSRAAVYIALRRLENRGLLRSQFGEATAERGGRAKRYFRLQPRAMKELRAHRNAMLSMWDGFEPELSDP